MARDSVSDRRRLVTSVRAAVTMGLPCSVDEANAALDRITIELEHLAWDLTVDESALLGRLLGATGENPVVADWLQTPNRNAGIAQELRPARLRAADIAESVLDISQARAERGTSRPRPGAGSWRRLGHALGDLFGRLDETDRRQLRELLSNALGGLSPSGEEPTQEWRSQAWQAAVGALSASGPSGVTPIGRPAFIDDDLLAGLIRESNQRYWLGDRLGLGLVAPPGPLGDAVAAMDELCDIVGATIGGEVVAGNGLTEGGATFVYYEEPGDGIQPHCDPFELVNAILMLEHALPDSAQQRSALLVFRPEEPPRRVVIEPGEMFVVHGPGTVHAREPMNAGERIANVVMVFRRRSVGEQGNGAHAHL